MKITFVSPAIDSSGGSKVLAIYAQHLTRRGNTVLVVSVPVKPPSIRDTVRTVIRDPISRFRRPKGSPLDWAGVAHRVLESNRPVTDSDVPDADVIIATWWETAEWVNRLSPAKGTKVYFIQGHETFPNLPKRSRDTYKLPLYKIVVSLWLKNVMASEYGSDADLVMNSVDKSQFYSPPRTKQKRPTVGLLYATAWPKGLDVAIAALKNVRNTFPNLEIISFGNERPNSSFKLPGRSTFHFSPSKNELREIYSTCDVWLTASRSEGFNLTSLEAMSCGTPTVATKTGWPADGVKTGVNGVLTDIDDVDALAKGVEWVLIRDQSAWGKLSHSASQTMASPSWSESVVRFEQALKRAISKQSLKLLEPL